MKNNEIKKAYDSIQPNFAAKVRVLEKVKERSADISCVKQHKKRPFMRSMVALATTAAVIAFALFGNMLTNQPDNMFFLTTYAMEQQADGTVELREIVDINQADWGGYFDGENLFLNIALRPAGENIQSVDFRVDTGFLAKQYITRENGVIVRDDRTPMIVTQDGNIALFGVDFEIMGNSFTLAAYEITENLLLFWGQEWDSATRPGTIVINAVATFDDGSMQEESITVVFAGRTGAILGPVSDRVPGEPLSREFIEERIRYFEERGWEIPQVLLDMLDQNDYVPNTPQERVENSEAKPVERRGSAGISEREQEPPAERRPIEPIERPEPSSNSGMTEADRAMIEERIRELERLGMEVPRELLQRLND